MATEYVELISTVVGIAAAIAAWFFVKRIEKRLGCKDPSSIPLEMGFTRDVSQLGHAGTGDLEIRLQTAADLERAQPLLLRSYQGV
jgi:predicted transport protein